MFSKENNARGHWIFLLSFFSVFIASIYGDCVAPDKLNYAILDDQFIGKDSFSVDAVVSYNCIPGYSRIPGKKNTITCLSDSTWSSPETFCERRSCGNPGDAENGDAHYDNTLFGSIVNYTCHPGYHMLSKRNYRACQANGVWSNEVPVCGVQSCTPPLPITDGSFDPAEEEYAYQTVVKYQCSSNKFALIGEPSMFCTSNGNWSSDPPKCVAVECPSPNVANAQKLTGLVGPYYFNNAITFGCSPGFTLKGASLVQCNDKSQWEPPLPTCSENNNVAAVMGNSMVILTLILMGHVISHHF